MNTLFPIWFYLGTFEGPTLTSFSHFFGDTLKQPSDLPKHLLGAELTHFTRDSEGETPTVTAQWQTPDQCLHLSVSWTPSAWELSAQLAGQSLFTTTFSGDIDFSEVLTGSAHALASGLAKNPLGLPFLYHSPQPDTPIAMDDFAVEVLIPIASQHIREAYDRFQSLSDAVSSGWIRGDIVLQRCVRSFPQYDAAKAAYQRVDTGFLAPDKPERDGSLTSYIFVLHVRTPLTLVSKVWETFASLHQSAEATLGPALHFISPASLITQGCEYQAPDTGIRYQWDPFFETLRNELRLGEKEPGIDPETADALEELDYAYDNQNIQMEELGLGPYAKHAD